MLHDKLQENVAPITWPLDGELCKNGREKQRGIHVEPSCTLS